MNLRECFEKIDTETWAINSGLNTLILLSEDFPKILGETEYFWAKKVFDIISGDITFDTIFNESLNKGNLIRAARALNFIEEPHRSLLAGRLESQLFSAYDEVIKKLDTERDRINSLKKRNIDEAMLSLLEEVEQHLSDLQSIYVLNDFSYESVSIYFRNYIQKFKNLQETIDYLETDVSRNEKQLLEDSYGQLVLFIETIRPLITNTENPQRKLIDRFFLASPQLVLSGRKELLSTATEAVKLGRIETLVGIDLPNTPTGIMADPKTFDIVKPRKQQGQQKLQRLSLRPMTSYYLKDAGFLEGNFEAEQGTREFVQNKLSDCRTDREAALLLLKASNTISTFGQDALDMQGKGLILLAEALLVSRKYTPAFELFIDGFHILDASDHNTGESSSEKQTAITGALLADWAPRLVGQTKNLAIEEIINSIILKPYSMLEALRSNDEMSVVFHTFDELYDLDAFTFFVEYLENVCPKVEWRLVLLERDLQPRIFLKNIRMRTLHIRALVEGKLKSTAINLVLKKLDLIMDADSSGRTTTNEILEQIDRAIAQSEQEKSSTMDNGEALSKIFVDGMRKIYDSLRDKIPHPTEILFAVRPVNSTFFLEEQNENLEFILNISIQDASLPISSLSVTCRIDEDQRAEMSKLVTIQQATQHVGYLEPGTIKELSFFIDVDKSILTRYASTPFRFDFSDGIKAIEPSDNKHVIQINFRASRLGSKINPYIAGKAVEKWGLFIGREREMDRIKKTLIGQTQDNIPLVLGIRRIGKTSLLKRLIDDVEIQQRYVPVFIDLQDMPESETNAEFFKKICEQIHKECGDKWKIPFSRSNFTTEPSEAFLTYLYSLTSAKGNKKILLMLDECERLISNIEKWQIRLRESGPPYNPNECLLPEVFGTMRKAMLHANRVSFIVCGLPTIMGSFREYESRWFGLMEPIVIKPLDIEEAKQLIQPTKTPVPYKVSQEGTTHILYMSGRQPYLIQLICRKLFDYAITSGKETMSKKEIEEIIDTDILPHEGYFSDYESLIGDDRPILKAITIAHEKRGKRLQFAPIEDILDQLRLDGHQISRNQLLTRLKDMELSERPLVERSPSHSESYRIVIGLLSTLIQERLGVESHG
jgi:hypothetical protein